MRFHLHTASSMTCEGAAGTTLAAGTHRFRLVRHILVCSYCSENPGGQAPLKRMAVFDQKGMQEEASQAGLLPAAAG